MSPRLYCMVMWIMGHTAGLTKGFMAIGLAALAACLVWPPLTAKLAIHAFRQHEWKLALLASAVGMIQATVVGGLIYWLAT